MFRLGFGEQEARFREREKRARERERDRDFLEWKKFSCRGAWKRDSHGRLLPGPRRQDVGFQVWGLGCY